MDRVLKHICEIYTAIDHIGSQGYTKNTNYIASEARLWLRIDKRSKEVGVFLKRKVVFNVWRHRMPKEGLCFHLHISVSELCLYYMLSAESFDKLIILIIDKGSLLTKWFDKKNLNTSFQNLYCLFVSIYYLINSLGNLTFFKG